VKGNKTWTFNSHPLSSAYRVGSWESWPKMSETPSFTEKPDRRWEPEGSSKESFMLDEGGEGFGEELATPLSKKDVEGNVGTSKGCPSFPFRLVFICGGCERR